MQERPFRATLKDVDGEEYSYDFLAGNLWAVSSHIWETMRTQGDFYGHDPFRTISLDVSELYDVADLGSSPIRATRG